MVRPLLIASAAVVTAFALAAGPAGAAVRMTHKISIKGELADHWTVNDPAECGPVGDGTLTVGFRTTAAVRVRPYIDPYIRAETRGYGVWVVTVPIGNKGLKGMPDVRATGTIARVDNTTPRPRASGDACGPQDKTGCGSFPLSSAKAGIGRYDRHRITLELSSQFDASKGPCLIGGLDSWNRLPYSGGPRSSGDLVLKMPSPSTLKRRRVVRVTGTSHKRTTSHDRLVDDSPTITDDVTRKATVTFTRR